MHDAYPLGHFYEALNAWAQHEKEYLKALEIAHQPRPTDESITNYRSVWIEGYLEAKINAESK